MEQVSQMPTELTYEKKRADLINLTPGDLTDLECDVCLNRGYIATVKKDNLCLQECQCVIKRRSLNRLRRSGLEKLVETYTFESYSTKEQWQADAKQQAMQFLSDYQGKWFIACGSVGSGKTHICTAMCKELIEAGKDVKYMMWLDESLKLKATVNDIDEYDYLIKDLKSTDILYIDDLFKTEQGKTPTSADVRLAFEILNHRYTNKKTTIISTERPLKNLLEIDEAVGSRIYEMTKDYRLPITGNKNWRLK